MPDLTVPDDFRDLLDASWAILATNGANGCPQVTAVAYLYDPDDERIKISLNDARQKAKNLRRDPLATLFIHDPNNPLRSLEIRSRVELQPDTDFAFAALAGSKYGAESFHMHDRPEETRSIVILHPIRIVANVVEVGEDGRPLPVPPAPVTIG
jgi:PPOX class probable F420-dependent enzyme